MKTKVLFVALAALALIPLVAQSASAGELWHAKARAAWSVPHVRRPLVETIMWRRGGWGHRGYGHYPYGYGGYGYGYGYSGYPYEYGGYGYSGQHYAAYPMYHGPIWHGPARPYRGWSCH